jgi:cell division septum initiation protein DivIVA
MKYNLELDSDTRLTISHALRVRIEELEEQLREAQKVNESIKIEQTIAYWQREIDNTKKALDHVRNNCKWL